MAPISTLPGTQITLIFREDGTYQGSAGCNTYNGTYNLGENNVIQLSAPIATKQICQDPQGIMEQEAEYLSLLPKVVNYQVDPSGQTLVLLTNDHWQLNFQQLMTTNP